MPELRIHTKRRQALGLQFLSKASPLFISVINQLDSQNFFSTVSLFHASTCFEHMCSSSGGQNYTASGIITPIGVMAPIGVMIPEAV